jgi:hypothetical protein
MRWRLYLFLILAFLGISIAYLGGYIAHDSKYAMASALLFFVSVDVILLGMGVAQDDGAKVQNKNNCSTQNVDSKGNVCK